MAESSEKRRDRLKAMRTEASNQSQSQPQSSPSSSSNLSNPLINTSSSFKETTSPIPRFDFYTDPMAAFSGSKRSNPDSFSSPIRGPSPYSQPSNRPNAVPRNYNVAAAHTPPGHQFQTSPSPNQSPWRSPIQFQAGHQFQTSLSPNQSPWRSPIQFQSPFYDHIRGTPPTPNPNPNANYWNRSGGSSPSYALAANYSPMGGGHPSPSFRHGGSPGPYSNPGRGNSSRFSPRPGQSGGRGRGLYNRHESSHHYIKTMVKDPWRKLKPIVGNILVPRFHSGSWLPKSITSKRAKVVESGGAKSRLSLAESLALSLEEAVGDE